MPRDDAGGRVHRRFGCDPENTQTPEFMGLETTAQTRRVRPADPSVPDIRRTSGTFSLSGLSSEFLLLNNK